MIKISIKIICIILLLFSCNINENSTLEKHLKNMNEKKILKNKIYNNWDIDYYFSDKLLVQFTLSKKIIDTLYSIDFRYDKNKKTYLILDYSSIYKDKQTNYYVITEIRYDTLFCYKLKNLSDNPEDWIFIVGKYEYLYNHGMNEKQRAYYKLHRDSLIKVRGNDLPILPELNE